MTSGVSDWCTNHAACVCRTGGGGSFAGPAARDTRGPLVLGTNWRFGNRFVASGPIARPEATRAGLSRPTLKPIAPSRRLLARNAGDTQ
jgi:hypothetical protein